MPDPMTPTPAGAGKAAPRPYTVHPVSPDGYLVSREGSRTGMSFVSELSADGACELANAAYATGLAAGLAASSADREGLVEAEKKLATHTRLFREIEAYGTKRVKCWTCKQSIFAPADVDEGIPIECCDCTDKRAARSALAQAGKGNG